MRDQDGMQPEAICFGDRLKQAEIDQGSNDRPRIVHFPDSRHGFHIKGRRLMGKWSQESKALPGLGVQPISASFKEGVHRWDRAGFGINAILGGFGFVNLDDILQINQ